MRITKNNMEEINPLNIPAFKRKRSIAAKARRKPAYETAIAKQPKKHKTAIRKRQQRYLNEETLMDIPVKRLLPSQEIFPDPMLDMKDEDEPNYKKSNSEIREMKRCGICEGYFDKINVAVIKLTSPLRQGDIIIFEQEDGLFEQEVTSMQINRKDISLARTGSDIGLKVMLKPKVGTPVYKLI